MTRRVRSGPVDGRGETDSHVVCQGSQLSRTRDKHPAVGVVAFTVLTSFTYFIARYRIFTGFARYDDEGYMLLSLKAFLNHGWLYDGAAGYGPFYYSFWGTAFSMFGLPVNHNSGRTATLVVWILTSLIIGLSTWRVTDSIILGVATQLSAFEALFSLVNEPMHPGGIIVLLLASVFAFSCFIRNRLSRVPIALLGGAVMALILVKINVGIFVFAALALVCAVSYPALGRRRWLRPLIEIGFVAMPLLLMSSQAGQSWARHYGLHVFLAAIAVVIGLRGYPIGRRSCQELGWLVGGFLVVGLTISLSLLVAGASPSGLIDGVIVLPLQFRSTISLPLVLLPNWIHVLDLLSLTSAFCYWYLTRDRGARMNPIAIWLIATGSIFVGLVMGFGGIATIAKFTPEATLFVPCQFRWALLAFAWVALIEPPGKPEAETQFTRLLLPPLAVLQTLHAFPVAGSQVFWSTLLLIPVGALCVANGIRWVALICHDRVPQRATHKIGSSLAVVAIFGLVGVHLTRELDSVRGTYDASVPLELPGAERVRVSPQDAASYQTVAAGIKAHCGAFVMLPRINSFYLWTQQEPPSGYDPLAWSIAFDDARQQQAIDAIDSIGGLCLIENIALVRVFDSLYNSPPHGPLDRYPRQRGFIPIAKFGDYQVLKREEDGS